VASVEHLMSIGANPDAPYGEVDFEECSVAHMAVYWDSIPNYFEVIQALVQSNKVNWDDECRQQDNSVPIYEAVRHNQTEVFDLLLPVTTNFAGTNFRGYNIVHAACNTARNDYMCAKLLTVDGLARRSLETIDDIVTHPRFVERR